MTVYSTNKNILSAFIGVVILLGTEAFSSDRNDDSYAVFNKLKFFSWLVNASPTMDRILKSSDTSAIEQLDNARDLLRQAQQQFDNGELTLANKNIAAGIKQMSSVSRKIKDEDRIESARKKLFHELKQHIEIFTEAFERVASEKNDAVIDAMLDRNKLNGVMEEAKTLYQEGQYALANHQLKQAADMVELALTDARHKEVLLHALNFDSLEDEYIYEKKRNESYVLLIRLLQGKQSVSDASRQYVNKIVSSNRDVVKQAEQHASKGNQEEAIRVLEKGTDKLSRALRMSGAPL